MIVATTDTDVNFVYTSIGDCLSGYGCDLLLTSWNFLVVRDRDGFGCIVSQRALVCARDSAGDIDGEGANADISTDGEAGLLGDGNSRVYPLFFDSIIVPFCVIVRRVVFLGVLDSLSHKRVTQTVPRALRTLWAAALSALRSQPTARSEVAPNTSDPRTTSHRVLT